MVISILNEKGGSGKTTLAINLAFKFSNEGLDMLLVDADPQRSVETFMGFRADSGFELPFSSISKVGSSLSKEIKNFIPKYDSIIIDTGGRDSNEMRQALLISDLIIIPTIASGYDQAVLNKMIELIKETTIMNEKIKALIVINRANPNPFLNKKIEDLKSYLESKDIGENVKIAKTIIYEREIYKNVVFSGLGISELEENNKAKKEIDSLYCDLLNFVKE
ncbi:AAA family ATPase [Campylobacter peloridis]|uniref:AAA family ATPase n=1 Tax=Campylobacter peloridis TaxID=488546 RepID=A0A5C7DZM6_9BACT|nr:AAA family ATPase [Campylobacter peloridis]TXE84753.1 AAA family ATPase [Campylobacter peloridis]